MSSRLVTVHRLAVAGAVTLSVAVPICVLASGVTLPHILVPGQVARASDVNDNFAALAVAVNDNDSRIATLQATSLSGSQHSTLTGGGNADALHVHAASGATALKLRAATLSTTTTQEVVNHTGRGVLKSVRWTNGETGTINPPASTGTLNITIDGDSVGYSHALHNPAFTVVDFGGNSRHVREIPLGDGVRFNSSLRIWWVGPGEVFNLLVVYAVE